MEASVSTTLSVEDLWKLVTNKDIIENITNLKVRSDITDKEGSGNGVLTIGNGVFFARYIPFEAELNGTQAKLKVRATATATGSRIAIAAALPEDSILSLSSERLQGFLNNLRSAASRYSSISNQSGAGETYASPAATPSELSSDTNHIERETAPKQEINAASNRSAADSRAYDYFTSELSPDSSDLTAPKKKSRRGRRAAVLLSLFAILLSLVAIVYFYFRGLVTSTDMSYRVSLENAKSISLGMTKSQVAFQLGTNGLVEEDNRIVYRSVSETDEKQPGELISIIYDSSDRVSSVSYLDRKASNSIYKILSFPYELDAKMSVNEIVSTTGIPLSLYRKYSKDGAQMEEVHFGYLDPSANFDPAWRGEFVILLDRTNETITIRNWGYFDGSDPTMAGSIENTPFANQYDNYTDFLNDRFQYSRSLLLLNGYSLGDTKYFFDGEPVHYSNDFGYQFYSVDSAETLPDSEVPLYRISVGYDNKGAFKMASFSNMRLYNKAGTLKDSDYRAITRGMSYGEIRSLMRLVPTAIYIDSTYFSVCYGRFLNTDVADEQFEVIVRFDLENNYSQKVLINTAVAGASDGETKPALPATDQTDPGNETTDNTENG